MEKIVIKSILEVNKFKNATELLLYDLLLHTQ